MSRDEIKEALKDEMRKRNGDLSGRALDIFAQDILRHLPVTSEAR